MTNLAKSLVRQRLHNQKLTRSEFQHPADVVAWLGAVQAQDYGGSKWAIGLRANGLTDADVEHAFNEGAILRTHVMRPTWHFVAPADIRWIQSLTSPRVHAVSAYYFRKLGLDSRVFGRSRAALERALQGGTHLTRAELAAVLERAGIPAKSQRLAYLMMHAELEAVICSGPRRGKQFTYALIAERAPRASILPREEALAKLTLRYFSSHGPATVRDYVWWSGLAIRDARMGVAMIKSGLEHVVLGDRTYWFGASKSSVPQVSPAVHLLPNYDEYLIAYKDRGLAVRLPPAEKANAGERDEFAYHLVIDGRLAGSWRRTEKTDAVLLEAIPYARLTQRATRGLAAAAERYSRFIDKPLVLTNHGRTG